MTTYVIYTTGNYELTSYGNGLGFCFSNKLSALAIFLQGEDASTFRDELEALEDTCPEKDADDILHELWYRYDSLAELY